MAIRGDISLMRSQTSLMDDTVRLQLEDIAQIKSTAKGKQREGEVRDVDVALDLYLEELTIQEAQLSDQRMAHSIALAVAHDGDAVQHQVNQEQQCAADFRLASQLAGKKAVASRNQTEQKNHNAKDDDLWQQSEMQNKIAAIYLLATDTQPSASQSQDVTTVRHEDEQFAESSKQAAARACSGIEPLGHCISCGEDKEFFDVARVPCNHEYCRPCLEQLFTLSMKDETLFPPRCDREEIPLKHVRFFLPTALADEFEARYSELSTKNKTYCHNTSCLKFIDPAFIVESVATCQKCHETTCTMCKGSSHPGDCPEDEALRQLLQLADAEQWQRCRQCHRLVDLVSGCNHITKACQL